MRGKCPADAMGLQQSREVAVRERVTVQHQNWTIFKVGLRLFDPAPRAENHRFVRIGQAHTVPGAIAERLDNLIPQMM